MNIEDFIDANVHELYRNMDIGCGCCSSSSAQENIDELAVELKKLFKKWQEQNG